MAYKNDSKPAAASAEEMAQIQMAAKDVAPINELNADNRNALCKSAVMLHVQRNEEVKHEDTHRWMMYLVEGSIALYSGKDEIGHLQSNTPAALKPLFEDKGAYSSIRSTSAVKFAKFGREQLDILLKEQQKNAVSVKDVHVGELDNLVFKDIVEAIEGHSVSLPSSSDGALKILSSFARVAGIPELAEVIQCDPGLTAHIIRVANRVDVGTDESTHSIRGAITRLGVEETQRAIAELLKVNTMVPANKVIDARMKRYCQRTSLAASIAQVLSRDLPHLQSEVAMLVALVTDIGELLVLKYANSHADRFTDEHELAVVIENLRVIVGSWLISSWGFSEEFKDGVLNGRDWYRSHTGEITYTDLVTAALLIIHSVMPDSQPSSIPGSDNLLLARHLQQAGINISEPSAIVKAATSRIVNVQALLKAA